MSNDTVKPPLGLMPEFIHKENRYREIHAAIKRYVDANKDVPADWLRECEALDRWLKNRETNRNNMNKYTKKLEMSGINGKFTASVEVLFNHRTETKEVHNRSTHDEEKRTFSYHVVYGYIGGEKVESPEFQNENLVWQYIDQVEKELSIKLHRLANVPHAQTLTEQLCGKGFKQE